MPTTVVLPEPPINGAMGWRVTAESKITGLMDPWGIGSSHTIFIIFHNVVQENAGLIPCIKRSGISLLHENSMSGQREVLPNIAAAARNPRVQPWRATGYLNFGI